MKIGGVEVTKCDELLVLYRGDGNHIPIRAQAVSVREQFDKMVPEPTAPLVQKPDGNYHDYSDADYKRAVVRRNSQYYAYLCLRSLEPSGIEWKTVDLEKPNTWLNWEKELTEAGLADVEIQRIQTAVMVANALDESKLEEARKAFLRGQGQ